MTENHRTPGKEPFFCEKWSFTIYNADSVVSVFPFEQFQSRRYARADFRPYFVGRFPESWLKNRPWIW